jgi:lipopolysaccharide/colanic/teichoic acid biosynthesis glycosyltransferase
MIKRSFDLILSLIGVILLSPILLGIWVFVNIDSRGGGFYRQTRVGKNGKDFKLWKFRTMSIGADKGSLLTVGGRDSRITKIGYNLRRFKLDELPQLFNVIWGDMSLVGPRPEVRKYVDLYSNEQLKVLSVKPGITDFASIEYVNENELLAKSSEPEKTYINEIMPAKLQLNLKYIQEKSLIVDMGIILKTIGRILE